MQDSLQIFTASSGKSSARVLLSDDTTRHLHSTVKPEAEADYFKDFNFWGNIIVFAGIGLGYHLEKKIKDIPPSALLILIDYYDKLIEHNLNNIFAKLPNKIVPISELNFKQKKTELSKLLKSVATPLVQIVKHPASFDIHRNFYDEILSFMYSSLAQQQIKKTTFKKALLLHGNFFLQEECRKALQEINKEEPLLFKYETIQSGIEYESHLHKSIQKEKPDFILSINMKGFDGNGVLAETSLRFDIPVVVWFVDDPYPILLQQRKFINRNMTALCWEKAYLPYLEKQGFSRTDYLPLATAPAIFSRKTIGSPRVRLGFVGTSMGRAFLDTIKSRFLWSDTLLPLIEKASETLLDNSIKKISTILTSTAEELSITLPFSDERNFTWLCSYTIHTASMKKRKGVVSSLLPSGIELYGDPEGWKELLGNNIITHQDLDYNTQLCDTYRNIEINLNITSCQMPSAVNQRVFDIPMSGSFLLSDNQKDIGELFNIGKEVICYHDINELNDLVKHYSENEGERMAVIEAAQKRIKKEHTYNSRISSIIDMIKTG